MAVGGRSHGNRGAAPASPPAGPVSEGAAERPCRVVVGCGGVLLPAQPLYCAGEGVVRGLRVAAGAC